MTGVAARLTDVTVAFPRRSRPVLTSVSCDLPTGSRTLILGPSGSGKSTLLGLLTGLIPGSVTAVVSGNVDRPPTSDVGFLGQDPAASVCLPLVDQELAMVLEGAAVPPAEMDVRIASALRDTGASGLSGRRTAALSGGELQRVGLAAARLADPALLVFDEPTSMLDPAGIAAFRAALTRRGGAPTTVVVEHRLDELAGPAGLRGLPEQAIALGHEGTVLARGATTSVFAEAGATLHAAGNWVPLEVELQAVGGVPGGLASSANRVMLRSRRGRLSSANPGKPLFQARDLTVIREGATAAGGRLWPGVAITLRAGELVALLGPNGVGKTSLLLALAGLLPAATGVLLGERPAMAFQNPEHQFLAATVREEVGFGVSDPARIDSVLAEFRLTGLAGQNPFRLSGGEKRRLSLAANIVHDREVLLADEPTFGLDRRDAMATMRSLRTWADRGRGVLFTSHDLRCVAAHADRVIVLGPDGIVADGPTWDVLADAGTRSSAGLALPPLLGFLLDQADEPAAGRSVLAWLEGAPTRSQAWT